MKYLKLTTAMLAVFSLSACLGGGGDSVTKAETGDPTITPPSVSDFTAKANTLNDLEIAIRQDDFNIDLPDTGSANYAGIMELPDPSAEGNLVGEFNMEVDFAALEVSGGADNFGNNLDEVWSGSLVVEGTIDGGFDIDVDGTLTKDGLETVVDGYVANLVLKDISDDGVSAPEYVHGHLNGTAWTGGEKTLLTADNARFIGEITVEVEPVVTP